MAYFGELAALGTAFCWATAAIFFTSCARKIGAFSMNHYRVLCASLFLMLMHFAFFKIFWPAPITSLQLLLILASSLVGIVIGDTCLFQAYIDVGPRIGLLLFSSYPLIVVILAWFLLAEKLSLMAWIGFFVALSGIFWVIRERKENGNIYQTQHSFRGMAMGLSAAFCQALGLIIVKPAVSGENAVDPLSATLIRLCSATIILWLFTTVRGRISYVLSHLQNTLAMGLVLAGAAVGPFIGMWLFHVSLKLTQTGIAAILMATTPIMILPIVAIVYREKITWRALLGATIVFVGVSVLILEK